VVQVPTTLLAQVDASVGGKVAVNHPRGKNLIGAFHQPRLVLIDPETLRTLPEREYRSGLAEVVKTGAALNAELFASLEEGLDELRRRDAHRLEAVVAACCTEKARIVEQDEREETGVRMVLNYGHTIGHALEALSGYRRWLHGEAVAIGMAAAGRLAVRLGWTEARTVDRQNALLQEVGLPIRFTGIDPREIAAVLRHDKKAWDGRVRFVLLRAVGQAEVCDDVPMDTVIEVLREIQG
jgi:3-dehydroquinate synthase